MGTREWTAEDAGNRFGAVVGAAYWSGPQTVTLRGEPAVVVLEADVYRNFLEMADGSVPDFEQPHSNTPPDGTHDCGSPDNVAAHFGAIVDAALGGRPQWVRTPGKKGVVIMDVGGYKALRRKMETNGPTFADILLAIPKGGPDDLFEFEREPLDIGR